MKRGTTLTRKWTSNSKKVPYLANSLAVILSFPKGKLMFSDMKCKIKVSIIDPDRYQCTKANFLEVTSGNVPMEPGKD